MGPPQSGLALVFLQLFTDKLPVWVEIVMDELPGYQRVAAAAVCWVA
jgi:hypothetical protein